jgi:hypothetical protein
LKVDVGGDEKSLSPMGLDRMERITCNLLVGGLLSSDIAMNCCLLGSTKDFHCDATSSSFLFVKLPQIRRESTTPIDEYLGRCRNFSQKKIIIEQASLFGFPLIPK